MTDQPKYLPTFTEGNYLMTTPITGTTGGISPETKQKWLDRFNKPVTVWGAIAVAVITIWNTPGLKEQIAALITAPSLQNIGTLIGALIAAGLLYVSKPAGVS